MFKETPADLAVKERLWDATVSEVKRYAKMYADLHVVGERSSDQQDDLADIAKAKGYPKMLIRLAGSLHRRGLIEGQEGAQLLAEYKYRLGFRF